MDDCGADNIMLSFVLVAGVIIGITIGVVIAEKASASKIKSEAIERGVAEYNQTTGEWQWKQQEVKP